MNTPRHPIHATPRLSRLGDLAFVQDYATNFDGYEYAAANGIDLEELAVRRLRHWQDSGRWTGTFEELRLCLFHEQRRDLHVNHDDEFEAWLMDLYRAVCEAAQPA